ncbi:type II secretion system protein M [Dasania sp. GY-MA-18]|uniref:Type II secretion system protein M n=1 Tax=Dasania phycosphaerae TaxID=2950436 RepID=A0A9J6RHT2_9GAMM|nr:MULTISPECIES: type II secretion system protein M [Dasania]MCR8921802.1 type II secretion system protein M [Dasania sp. GY-MA-18]MCZ0864230.1 type II secretion system protein M [Dasania phycosphaerae]MCZ0867958.1 type II secretion system protein M [Dasania phycosphaerae]
MNLADWYSLPLVQACMHRYQQLSERDQLAVKILSVFLFIIVIVYGVIVPCIDYSASAKQQYQQAQADLQWMKTNTPANLATAPRRNPNESILGIASSSAKKYYIEFQRYDAQDENTLRINIERVLFKNLVLWLEYLEKQHGISLSNINIEQQGNPAYVNARVVIKG